MMDVGRNTLEGGEEFKMKVEVLNKSQDELDFVVENIDVALANTLRRIMFAEVPVMAVKDVEFKKNNSALYDEILAHRIGLIPLTTDLKSYNLPNTCKCDGEGCALCQVHLSISATGPCMVYAKDLKSTDPKVVPSIGDLPLVELMSGQKLEFVATSVLGFGKDHVKHSAGHVYYKGYPEFNVTGQSKIKEVMRQCGDVLKESGKGIEITDFKRWNDAHEQFCEECGVNITYSDTKFIFFIESWGQLKPETIFLKALEIFDKKLSTFEKVLSKAK